MKEEELFAVLRLQKAKSIGPILAKKLIRIAGSAQALFKESHEYLHRIHGIGGQIIAHLRNESNLRDVDKEMGFIVKNQINYSYYFEEGYPANLKHCSDAPLLLFMDGAINLSHHRIISIVGTRNMTKYGHDFCRQLVEGLSPYNPVIVSGLAYGVDICAHKEAIRNNLQTIAVLAHGLERVYPRSHKKYLHEICRNGGLITEFWHEENPLREHFLQRNRIVAGLSEVTIVIESAHKGGSLVTADIANSYNREVFALPGNINSTFSEGCNQLIKQHKAHMLTCVDDVISMMSWDLTNAPRELQSKPFVALDSDEQLIYDLLRKGPHHIDDIAIICHISGHELAPTLLQMELKGAITPLPGKQFAVT